MIIAKRKVDDGGDGVCVQCLPVQPQPAAVQGLRLLLPQGGHHHHCPGQDLSPLALAEQTSKVLFHFQLISILHPKNVTNNFFKSSTQCLAVADLGYLIVAIVTSVFVGIPPNSEHSFIVSFLYRRFPLS